LSSRAALVVTEYPPRPISAPCGGSSIRQACPLGRSPPDGPRPKRASTPCCAADRCEYIAGVAVEYRLAGHARALRSTRRELIRDADPVTPGWRRPRRPVPQRSARRLRSPSDSAPYGGQGRLRDRFEQRAVRAYGHEIGLRQTGTPGSLEGTDRVAAKARAR
jgi:hypothetical protein